MNNNKKKKNSSKSVKLGPSSIVFLLLLRQVQGRIDAPIPAHLSPPSSLVTVVLIEGNLQLLHLLYVVLSQEVLLFLLKIIIIGLRSLRRVCLCLLILNVVVIQLAISLHSSVVDDPHHVGASLCKAARR